MKAIIIGATSGIGRELAHQLSGNGWVVGATGRRTERLESLKKTLGDWCFIETMDLKDPVASVSTFKHLIEHMDGVDLVIISAGIGVVDHQFSLDDELDTARINVVGFTAIANAAYHYFTQLGHGHIVGISSVAAERGGPFSTYNASKAYVSSYLEGLACRRDVQNNAIYITDVRPGFVDTDMAKGKGIFWCAPVEKAVKQILVAIKQKQRVVYVTKRWRLVAWLIRNIPDRTYRKIMSKA